MSFRRCEAAAAFAACAFRDGGCHRDVARAGRGGDRVRRMTVAEPKLYGCQSQTGTLRRVLVRAPRAEDCARWREFGWRAEPGPDRLAAEHEAFAAELEAF